MSRANSLRSGRAFTLIEVLVALAIIAIGMLVVIQSVSQTAENSAYLRDKALAHWVAMNQLTAMRLSQTLPSLGSSNGEAEMGGQRWHWNAEVSSMQNLSMLQIVIAVRAADADEKSQMAIITGFADDKISRPGTLITQYSGVTAAPGSSVTVGGGNQPAQPTTPTVPPPNGTPPQTPQK